MKAMTIEVPREGVSIEFVLHGSASPAQAIIVAADDVDVRYGNLPSRNDSAAPAGQSNGKPPEKSRFDLDMIAASILNLRAKSRTAAVNVIRTMFQFTNPITIETANGILEDLRQRGDLSITLNDEIEFPDQNVSA